MILVALNQLLAGLDCVCMWGWGGVGGAGGRDILGSCILDIFEVRFPTFPIFLPLH